MNYCETVSLFVVKPGKMELASTKMFLEREMKLLEKEAVDMLILIHQQCLDWAMRQQQSTSWLHHLDLLSMLRTLPSHNNKLIIRDVPLILLKLSVANTKVLITRGSLLTRSG
jgi:hypothetical protein